jgi:hypothetical protein
VPVPKKLAGARHGLTARHTFDGPADDEIERLEK